MEPLASVKGKEASGGKEVAYSKARGLFRSSASSNARLTSGGSSGDDCGGQPSGEGSSSAVSVRVTTEPSQDASKSVKPNGKEL